MSKYEAYCTRRKINVNITQTSHDIEGGAKNCLLGSLPTYQCDKKNFTECWGCVAGDGLRNTICFIKK